MTLKPDDIKTGDVIRADWLNAAKNAPVTSVRGGGGVKVTQTAGGDVSVSLSRAGGPINNTGPQSFIIARVTEVDSGDPLLVTAIEQAWSDAGTDFIAAANGRTWDGESTNPPKVRIVDGQPRAVDDLVTLGHKFGPDNSSQWFVVPESTSPFWAKITGNATNGTNRWKYAWTEQNRTATGLQDMTGGRTGTTSAGFAINANEANNSGAGVQGNSIDIDGAVFTDNTDLEIQPVLGSPVVRMWSDIDDAGAVAFTFEYVNAVDGECA